MKSAFTSIAALGILIMALPAESQMGMMQGGLARHRFVMHNGVPKDYATRANPLKATDAQLKSGGKLYQNNCATCHGSAGKGDGVAAKGLNPPPANLAASVRMPIATDAFLYWTIAEGGAPVSTAMPPFKGTLKENQIWEVILHLRGL